MPFLRFIVNILQHNYETLEYATGERLSSELHN